MNFIDWIGFIGVSLLLFAYFLTILNIIDKDSWLYLLLNVFGAGIACFASVLLHYIPFILLEGSWTLVSLIGLIQFIKRKKIKSQAIDN